MNVHKELPSEEEVKKKVSELLNKKDYENAAKLICYYSLVKIGPEEFARRLQEVVKQYQEKKDSHTHKT